MNDVTSPCLGMDLAGPDRAKRYPSSRYAGGMSLALFTALIAFPFTARSTLAQERISPRGTVGTQKPNREVRTRFSPLVGAITTTINPDSWEELGGYGSIVAIHPWDLLIVSQTADVHRRIENLIATIRRARLLQAGGGDRSTGDSVALPGDNVARPVSFISESLTSAAKRKQIERVLSSEPEFEFVDTPLSEVAGYIQREFGIPVHVDKEALDDEGLDDDVPVTFRIPGIALRSALRTMLRELGLRYVIEEGVLLLTTPLRAEETIIERVYMVEDLAIPLANRALSKDTKSRSQEQR